MKHYLAALAAASVLTLPAPGFAVNETFLKEAPYAAYFTDEDRRIVNATLDKALDEGRDGETRRWENPATGASGEITVLARLAPPDANCRAAMVTNRARGRVGKGSYVFCKSGDGAWMLAPDKRVPPGTKPKSEE